MNYRTVKRLENGIRIKTSLSNNGIYLCTKNDNIGTYITQTQLQILYEKSKKGVI